jgi:hypothetical protein
MADEKTIDQVTSQELFEHTQQPSPPPAAETVQQPDGGVPPPVAEPAAAPPPPKPPEAAEAPIPSWRLREEADARRAAEDRARVLEARLNEVAQHFQQSQKQPDFFENPDEATRQVIAKTIQPYIEQSEAKMMYMGKMIASALHGADKVNEAEQAFLKARAEQVLDPVDYERVVQSPNRYDEVVQWHRRQAVLSSVGDDPQAWFEKQLEARMSDPKFQAQMMEKVRAGAATRPSETRLPPSLSRSTAVAPNTEAPVGDMSDKSLFEYAMRPKGRTQ